MSVVCDKIETGVTGLADQLRHIERRRACHPIGIGNELDVCVDPHVEPQVLKLGAEIRQPFRLRRLRAKFIEIEKFAQRLIAGEPGLLVEDIGIDRRRGQLQIDAGIDAKRGVVDHLTRAGADRWPLASR